MVKKALLIGINYSDNSDKNDDLYGCVNDVNDVATLLKKYNYNNIVIMTDEPKNKNTNLYPTRDNMIKNIKDFINSSKDGDTLYFHYSGHGGQTYDYSGDEPDMRDECIYDYLGNMIIDDELYSMMVSALPDGVILRCVFDCCHSGSCLDLPYTYSVSNDKIFTSLLKSRSYRSKGNGCFSFLSKPKSKSKSKSKSKDKNNEASDDADVKNKSRTISPSYIKKRYGGKNVISLSGCRDTQYSADAYFNKRSNGALTYAFLKALNLYGTNITWRTLCVQTKNTIMMNGITSQDPQLTSTSQNLVDNILDI